MSQSDILAIIGGGIMLVSGLSLLFSIIFFIPIILGFIILFIAGAVGDEEMRKEKIQEKLKTEIRSLEVDILNKKAIELGFESNYDYKKLIQMVSITSNDKELRQLQQIRKDLMIKKFGQKKVNELIELNEKEKS